MDRKIIIFLIIIISVSSCKKESMPAGKSGSFARMNVVDNFLYTISKSRLTVHNISNRYEPEIVTHVEIDNSIETLFPLSNKLFIGSTNGMFIYDIQKPGNPKFISKYNHFTACDPVISRNNYAYITLRSDSRCRRGQNELHILDISNIYRPLLVNKHEMSHPYGLGIDNDLLFIAEGEYGLSIYSVKNPERIKKLSQIHGLKAYDLILDNPYLYLIAADGLYIYNYHNFPKKTINKLSKIVIQETLVTRLINLYHKVKWWHIAILLYFGLIIFYLSRFYGAEQKNRNKIYLKVIFWIILIPVFLAALSIAGLTLFIGYVVLF